MRNKTLSLDQILRFTQAELKAALTAELESRGYAPIAENGYLYAPGTLPVLLVAHLDTVHHEPVRDICRSGDGTILMSPQGIGGDDRAGVYMALRILEQARCHVLFCEDEETGGQGARKFTASDLDFYETYRGNMAYQGQESIGSWECQKYTSAISTITGTQTVELWIEPEMGLCIQAVYQYDASAGVTGTKTVECVKFSTEGVALPSYE